MRVDFYTKCILTIIAGALILNLAFGGGAPLRAQAPGQVVYVAGIVDVDGKLLNWGVASGLPVMGPVVNSPQPQKILKPTPLPVQVK